MFGHSDTASLEFSEGDLVQLSAGSRKGFEALHAAADKLPPADRERLYGYLKDLLDKRLRLLADRRAELSIADERIEQPIIICGLPRSGTSLLHSLLAEDPANRAPTAWELMTPSPPRPDAAEKARRIAITQIALQQFIEATPGILAAHPYWDEGGVVTVECEDIMQMSFLSPYPRAFFDVPSYNEFLYHADHGPAYELHLAFLQQLQWQAPPRRWVLKGIGHTHHLGLVDRTYPDSLLVWPHRDPVEQFLSMLTITSVTRRASDPVELRGIYEDLLEWIGRGFDAALASPLLRSDRVLHLQFADINRDPMSAIEQIYDRVSSQPTGEHRTRMAAWLAAPEHDAARHGRAKNDFARYGATAEDVRARFANYYDSGLLKNGD